MPDPLELFADIQPPSEQEPETYPGSRQKRRAVAGPRDTWAALPGKEFTLRGKQVKFYGISVLAGKLERGSAAMRKWERLGYLPPTPYRSPGVAPNGQRRMYTRAQIEGLVTIAKQEGLLGDYIRNVSATDFPTKAARLFKRLSEEA